MAVACSIACPCSQKGAKFLRQEMHEGSERLTVEKLAADCIDVRRLKRKGLLKERTVTFRPLLRWPQVAKMKADRYVIEVNFYDLVTPQYIHLSWTPCH